MREKGKLAFGLIGCGKIAPRHAAILTSLPGAELVAVCDRNQAKALALANKYGVPAYVDYREMLAAEVIDVVTIATPSGTHAEIAFEAARTGKHLVIEKPLALRLEDANALIKECDRLGVKLFEVRQNRYNPPVLKLYEAVREGRLGRISLATARVRWCRPEKYYTEGGWRGTWPNDGGVFANQAIHHIDLLLWLVGHVETVLARGATSLAPIEAEDVGVAIFRFSCGAIGVLEATTAARPHDIESSVSILGERGTVEIGGVALDTVKVWAMDEVTDEDHRVIQEFSSPSPAVLKQGHHAFYKHVVECMRDGQQGPIVDGQEARKALEVLSAIYESMETGEEVVLRFRPKRCRLGELRDPPHLGHRH